MGRREWTEEDYLEVSDRRPRVELSDGVLEVLPVPTERHQALLMALLVVLHGYAAKVGGRVRPPGLRVRVAPGRFREPDAVFLARENLHKRAERYWTGADLVVEVVSGGPEDEARDRVRKRREYAEAGIREYWIVDPEAETLTVLKLEGSGYAEHGVFARGATATSAAFEGLAVDVAALFDAD